jgi:hypothetical protein
MACIFIASDGHEVMLHASQRSATRRAMAGDVTIQTYVKSWWGECWV